MVPSPASGSRLAAEVIHAARDAFVSIDEDGRILDWNPAAEALFGWTAAEAAGQPLAETIVPPGLRSAHTAGMARFLREGTPRVMGQRLELSGMHRDGHELPIEITIWPAEVDRRLCFHSFIRGIGDRLRRDRYLDAHNAVARALAGAGTFAEGITAAMRALAAPLRWDVGAYWRLQPDGSSLRAAIVWRGDGAGNGEFERLTRALRARPGHGLTGEVLRTGKVAWIDGLPAGGFPRSAASAREGLRTAIALPVADSTGLCGVLEFFAHDEVRPDGELLDVLGASCTVIGQFVERCAQADRLKAAHAAALEGSRLQSEFLADTSHEIRRPLLGGARASSPSAPAPAPRPTKPVVLVAEDHPLNLLVIRKLIEEEGIEVDSAADGAEALARINERDYDAVFMDCQMPVLDGFAATGAIRACERGAMLPIIALTAHAMKGDRERCIAAGMDDYLTKPIVAGELARVLERWVPRDRAAPLDPAAT